MNYALVEHGQKRGGSVENGLDDVWPGELLDQAWSDEQTPDSLRVGIIGNVNESIGL